MEPKKRGKTIAFYLIGFLLVLFIVFSVYQHFLIKSLVKQKNSGDLISAVPENNSESVEKNDFKHSVAATPNNDELNYQLQASEEELDMARNQLADKIAKQEESRQADIEFQKQLMKDPSFRNVMKNTIEKNYGVLIKNLGLSGYKLDSLIEIILDRQIAMQDLTTEIQGANLTPDQAIEMKERRKRIEFEYDNKALELLGEEAASEYAAYKDRMGERSILFQFEGSLDVDDSLTDNQREELIDSMYEARLNVVENLPFEVAELFGGGRNEDAKNKVLDYINRVSVEYISSASNILSEPQMEKFERYINQTQQIQKKAIEKEP